MFVILFILQLTHSASKRINSIAKNPNFSNSGAKEMEFSLFDGGDDDEYNGVVFVEVSKIFAMQDDFILITKPSDGV